jgi:PAS domain S-box-containing protein
MVAKDAAQFFLGKDRKVVAENARSAKEQAGPPARFECTAVRKDASRMLVQIQSEFLTIDEQPALLWHVLDISHWRDAETAVEQKSRENETLERLLDAVHQSADRGDVQRLTLAAALRWLGYDSGGLFMQSPDGTTFLLETHERLPAELVGKLCELPAGEGLMGYISKTIEPVRVTLDEYPAHLPYRALFESENVRALAFLPLVHNEKLAGVLMLLASKAHEVPPYHIPFLEIVARHLGFAIEKAAVYGAIQRRADAYQDAIEQLSSIIYVAAPNGTFQYCSPAIESLTGYKVREIAATPDAWRAIVHPDDRSLAAERISRQAGAEQEFVLEYRILPKGKASYVQVRDTVRYKRGTDGAVLAIHGIVVPVAGRQQDQRDAQVLREARLAVHEGQRKINELTLINEISKGLTETLDRQSALELLHARLIPHVRFDAFGYDAITTPPDILKRIFGSCGDIPADIDEPLAWTDGVLPGGHPFRQLLQASGPMRGSSSAFGAVLAVPVSVRNHTDGILWMARRDDEAFGGDDLRLVESIASLLGSALHRIVLYDETMARVQNQSHRADSVDRFARIVSHDLKEPLIAIGGYTRLVLEDAGPELDGAARDHLNAVLRSSTRMKELIDDLLILSKVGHSPHRDTRVSICDLLAELTRDLAFFLHERRARVEYSPDLPDVHGDLTELGIVFRNLIVNGVHYNRRESPMISISATQDAGSVTFSIADNGIGIEKADADRVFEMFQRLDPVENFGGSGAGLAIVKKIVESGNGRIWLESTPDVGTTFYFTVPKHV